MSQWFVSPVDWEQTLYTRGYLLCGIFISNCSQCALFTNNSRSHFSTQQNNNKIKTARLPNTNPIRFMKVKQTILAEINCLSLKVIILFSHLYDILSVYHLSWWSVLLLFLQVPICSLDLILYCPLLNKSFLQNF